MFSHIKTSKKNKDIVFLLTRKLNLGTENIISRVALCYSIAQGRKQVLGSAKDSSGKEYSKVVLFGQYLDYYLGIVALFYDIHISDKDIPKYIKMHIDDGLELLNNEVSQNPNIDGFDFLADKINIGLSKII